MQRAETAPEIPGWLEELKKEMVKEENFPAGPNRMTELSGRSREKEVLAGRIDKTLIGFYAISEGTGYLDQMGYVVHEEKCRELIESSRAAGTCDSAKTAAHV